MTTRTLPSEFLVAFSFAGEQRNLVREIAIALEKELGEGTVFFDEWFEYYIAGDDADLRLQEIYAQRCQLAVVCVSERYEGKPWTRAEHAAIRARQMELRTSLNEQDQLRILPLRVGDGEVKGITANTICPDARQKSVHQTAELIVNRLRLIVPHVAPRSQAQETRHWVYLAESTSDMDELRDRMKVFLEDLNWMVLPAEPYPEKEYRTRLDEDLRRCRAFVQLLGPYPWKRGGFDKIQSEAAAALSIARYRYRSPEIELAKVESSHGDFLAAPDIITAGFDDFKEYLRKKLVVLAQRLDQPFATDIPPRVLVALRCENADLLWEKVFQWLYEQEHLNYYQLRADESFFTAFQAEPCSGFLVVCDASALQDDDKSPRDLLEQCRHIQLRQKDATRRPPVALVYWPPPPPKWAFLLRSIPLKLHRILGDQPVNLKDFFTEVRKTAA
jgi:hypothetical protein